MAVLVRIVLVLVAMLHIQGVMSIPVPFHDVEEAWKQGRSEVSSCSIQMLPPASCDHLIKPSDDQLIFYSATSTQPN